MTKEKMIALGAVAIVALGAGAYFLKQNPTPVTAEKQTPAKTDEKQPVAMKAVTPPSMTAEQTAQLAAGKEDHTKKSLSFNVNGGNFYYVPNEIRVKKGDTVTINFKNDGGFHDFNLDEFKVKIGPNKAGESGTATFVADKSGSFEYYCSVGSHRQMGQKGTLIVE